MAMILPASSHLWAFVLGVVIDLICFHYQCRHWSQYSSLLVMVSQTDFSKEKTMTRQPLTWQPYFSISSQCLSSVDFSFIFWRYKPGGTSEDWKPLTHLALTLHLRRYSTILPINLLTLTLTYIIDIN